MHYETWEITCEWQNHRFLSNKYFSQACPFQNPFFMAITEVVITLKMLKTKISKCRSGFVDGAYEENLCSSMRAY